MQNPAAKCLRRQLAAITGICFLLSLFLAFGGGRAFGQTPDAPVPVQMTTAGQSTPPTSANASPAAITFDEAMRLATANNPQTQAALTALGLAHQDLVQSRAGLLPSASYNMQDLYTQLNASKNPVFIANNGAHEYIAQGNVHENLSLQTFADYGRASAAQAVARAKSEIALRGLAVTVAQAYYGYLAAQRKFATAQRAHAEAQRFFDISD